MKDLLGSLVDYRELEGLDPPGLDLLAKEIREMIIKTV
jgi:hypothetical protein